METWVFLQMSDWLQGKCSCGVGERCAKRGKEICLTAVPGVTALLSFCLIEETTGYKAMEQQLPIEAGFSFPFVNWKGENGQSGDQLGGCSCGLEGSR